MPQENIVNEMNSRPLYNSAKDKFPTALREKTMARLPIKSTTAADEPLTVSVLVQAFSADPAARWLYPDARQYNVNFPKFVRAFGGKAFEYGSAYTVEDYSGAALWLPPDVHPDEEALAELVQRSVSEHRLEAVVEVLGQMDSYHPNEPHWYLPMIGVGSIAAGERIRLGVNAARTYLVRSR